MEKRKIYRVYYESIHKGEVFYASSKDYAFISRYADEIRENKPWKRIWIDETTLQTIWEEVKENGN